MAYGGFRQIFGPLLRMKRGQVTGKENLPAQPPFILAMNHEGFFDPLVLLTILYEKYKRKVYFLTAENIWSVWGEYLAKNWLGMIPLHKETDEGKRSAIDEAVKYLQQGDIFGIFPEGGRNTDKDNLLKGKTGAVRIAIKSRVKIVPIGLVNETGHRIGEAFKSIYDPNKKVHISIGSAMEFSEYYDQEISKEILDKATRRLMLEIGRLCNKQYKH